MGYIKDNYQTTNQFFKDVKNGINDIGLRLDDLESRREDVTGGGIQQVLDEEPEEVTVDPFQYEGPFAVISKEEGYRSKYTGTSYTTITEITTAGAHLSSGYDMEHYVGVWISSGAININNKRIQIAGKGSSVSSGHTHTNYYVAIPDDHNLFIQLPAMRRGSRFFRDDYSEDIFDNYYENHSASYPYLIVSEGVNPTYADWYDTYESDGQIVSSSIKGKYEYVMIAQNRGGKIIQTQFGEITDIPQIYTPPFASSAGIANYASEAGYRGPFHVERTGSDTYSSGSLHGFVNIFDNTNFYSSVDSTNIPYAGHIVQGASHFVVPGGYRVPVDYGQDGVANIYLYRDEDDVSSPYKFSAVVSGATENPFSSFYTRLAVDFAGVIKQTQYGDIVDVESGGSTIINSSSIYSSTYVDSRTINVDSRTFVTSTYIDSRSYSSTIITSGGMEYRGAFLVEGGIDSTQTDNPFIVSCVDGQGRANNVAGYVIAGNKRTAVTAMYGSALIDGARVYLVGTPNTETHTASYQIQIINNNGTPNVTGKQWYTQLAYKEGGQVYQTQFGDIVAPYEVPFASAATSAYNGGVNRIIAGSNTWISPSGGTGSVTINATGGGGSGGSGGSGGVTGGMLFPDYAALAGGNGGVTIQPGTNTSSGGGYTAPADGWLRVSIRNGYLTNGCFKLYLNSASVGIGMYQYNTYGGGTTAIIPIKSGTQINYTADGSQNMVVYAPGIGGGAYGSGGVPYPIYGNLTSGGGGHRINSGETYSAPADGWLRFSIKNETATAGCVQLTIGGAQIGLFECKSNAGGTTQMYPVKSGSQISYTAPSNCSCFVQFDH